MSSVIRETQGHAPEQHIPIIDQISEAVLSDHLRFISKLSGESLLAMLPPHHHLPEHDPARFVMTANNDPSFLYNGTDDLTVPDMGDAMLRSSFDLGVSFGRSIAYQVFSQDLLPVVTDFAPKKKERVVLYLREAIKRAEHHLPEPDDGMPRDLMSAIDVFIELCDAKITNPVKLSNNDDTELRRGFISYFKTLSLLEDEQSIVEPDTHTIRRFFRRFLHPPDKI